MSDTELRELERRLAEQPTEEHELQVLRAYMRAYGYKKLVKTRDPLYSTGGFFVVEKHLEARRPGRWGLLSSYVPGHGGDVWFVGHADKSVGAYSTMELNDEEGNSLYEK